MSAPEVVTSSGEVIPPFDISAQRLVDRTLLLFGPSGTGKTAIIKTFLHSLRSMVDVVIVVCPTQLANQSYDGYVHPALIHTQFGIVDPKASKSAKSPTSMAVSFLEQIMTRQEMIASTYRKANKLDVLATIYARLSREARHKGDRDIATFNSKREKLLSQLEKQSGPASAQVKKASEKLDRVLALIYKKHIAPEVEDLLAKKNLTSDEVWTLTYLHLNPRIVLVLDDCAAGLGGLQSKEAFRQLFYQGRHLYITVILSCQDDTDLIPGLRKNVFVSIFTSAETSNANFNRASNNFGKATRKRSEEVTAAVFSAGEHCKVAYIREDPTQQHFYMLRCKIPPPTIFGSRALAELCARVSTQDVAMDSKNPYYNDFMV
jgi:hypothetical protein